MCRDKKKWKREVESGEHHVQKTRKGSSEEEQRPTMLARGRTEQGP